MKWTSMLSLLGGGSLALFAALAFVAYTDWRFVDANTGSRKGYRQWMVGLRSGSWYLKSDLESFMESKHRDTLTSRWISYAGTGRNLFGTVRSQGHGRPGMIHGMPTDFIDDYCKLVSDVEKLQLYRVLSSKDEEAIQEIIDDMLEVISNSKSE